MEEKLINYSQIDITVKQLRDDNDNVIIKTGSPHYVTFDFTCAARVHTTRHGAPLWRAMKPRRSIYLHRKVVNRIQ